VPTDEDVATSDVATAEGWKETIKVYGQLLRDGFEHGIETFKDLLKPWRQEERRGAIMEFERLAPEMMKRLDTIAPNWLDWCVSL
jgi:hypothetical protein